MPCQLKRGKFASYQLAAEEVGRMSNCDDTEREEEDVPPRTPVIKKKGQGYIAKNKVTDISQETNFNLIAASCLANSQIIEPINQSHYLNDPIDNQHQLLYFEDVNDIINPEVNFVPSDANNSEAIDITLTMQIILQNQNKMFQKLAKLEVMFDELIKKINTGPKTCVSASKEAPTSVNPIKQIETVEELSALEEKLKNKNIFDEYVERMTFLCGNRRKGNGVDHAYMLMDNFFSRKFMTLCSWAGGARDKKGENSF